MKYLIIVDWSDKTRCIHMTSLKDFAINLVKKKAMTFVNKIELWELNDDGVTFTLILGKGGEHEQSNEAV